MESQNKPVYIYGIYDSVTHELRYIGKANNLYKRLKSHIRDSRRKHTPICNWIAKKVNEGQMPYMKVISESDLSGWQEEEKAQIKLHRLAGANLLNIAIGGNQPKKRSVNNAQIILLNQKRIDDPKYDKLRRLKQNLQMVLRTCEKHGNTTIRNKINKRLAERGIYV